MKKKLLFWSGGGVLFLLILIVAVAGRKKEETVYRESTAVIGDLTVGITEDGSIDIGTEDEVFDLDISALVSSSSEDTESGSGLSNGASAFGEGNMGGNMDMFNQIFSFAAQEGNTASTTDNTVTVAAVNVSVGQEVKEGDVLYLLEEDSVSEIGKKLETDVEKAKTDLEAAYGEQQVSKQSAEHTYDSSIAYGEYALTEYDAAIEKLEEAVANKEEALVLAKKEQELYQERLTAVTEETAKAKELLEAAEWGMENTDKQNSTYLYVEYFENYTQALSNYNTLEKEKEELESSLETAIDSIETLQTELSQADRTLLQGKLDAKETYDLRVLAYNTAEETYDIAVAYLDEEVKQQEEIYAAAEERFELFSSSIDGNSVLAKNDGIVTNVYLEAGDSLATDDTLITLYDLDNITMTVEVAEDDMTDIALEGAANVVLTAYPEEVFSATVTEISDASTDDSGNVTYSVTVTLTGDVGKLYQDMTGEVTFITRTTKEVLYISNRAVIRTGGKSYVKIKTEDGTIKTTEVTTGFSDGVNVEILSGLSEGDIVLIESKVGD